MAGGRGFQVAVLAAVVVGGVAGPVAADDRRARDISTFVVSQAVSGGAAEAPSAGPAVSADGRFVAFHSSSTDLLAGEEPWYPLGVFVRDTATGVTTRVSVPQGGGVANGDSDVPSISADGRYVAFLSNARNMVAGVHGLLGYRQVFVRDRVAGTTTAVSTDATGGWANSYSLGPAISGDGRYVAYTSAASDIVPGDENGTFDVFVRDLVRGRTTRVSVDRHGGDADGASDEPSISFDGSTVAFTSNAGDLVAGEDPGQESVFVRRGGRTTLVSAGSDGGAPDGPSSEPSVSYDGASVAFSSWASNLVAGDGNGTRDVFVRHLHDDPLRVSVARGGGDADDQSFSPSIDATGRRVAFASGASNLIDWDRNGFSDVFVRDIERQVTVRWSVDTSGGNPDGTSVDPAMAAHGDRVAFRSYARDLVGRVTNPHQDVFLARLDR